MNAQSQTVHQSQAFALRLFSQFSCRTQNYSSESSLLRLLQVSDYGQEKCRRFTRSGLCACHQGTTLSINWNWHQVQFDIHSKSEKNPYASHNWNRLHLDRCGNVVATAEQVVEQLGIDAEFRFHLVECFERIGRIGTLHVNMISVTQMIYLQYRNADDYNMRIDFD